MCVCVMENRQMMSKWGWDIVDSRVAVGTDRMSASRNALSETQMMSDALRIKSSAKSGGVKEKEKKPRPRDDRQTLGSFHSLMVFVQPQRREGKIDP